MIREELPLRLYLVERKRRWNLNQRCAWRKVKVRSRSPRETQFVHRKHKFRCLGGFSISWKIDNNTRIECGEKLGAQERRERRLGLSSFSGILEDREEDGVNE